MPPKGKSKKPTTLPVGDNEVAAIFDNAFGRLALLMPLGGMGRTIASALPTTTSCVGDPNTKKSAGNLHFFVRIFATIAND